MAVNLPTELLRSFAAIVDSGSMLRATERVFVTQSALSLQMKRLEETVQAYGRTLVMTQNRYDAGVSARVDVVQAEVQLKSARASLMRGRRGSRIDPHQFYGGSLER